MFKGINQEKDHQDKKETKLHLYIPYIIFFKSTLMLKLLLLLILEKEDLNVPKTIWYKDNEYYDFYRAK